MNLGKGYFKDFFNKLNTIDLILNSILTFCISVFLFYIVLPNKGYSNLKDYFVGETIYSNYNKFYDIYFVFFYIILFFIILWFYKKFKTCVFEQKIIQNKLTTKIAYPLQYLSLLGYFIIYPFDGHLYKGLMVIVVLLICAGIYDIQRLKKLSAQDGLIHFSVFSITAVMLICLGRFYSAQNFYIDTHHDAEHFSAYYMHTVHKMSYYKEVMLVHGGRDLAESWLAEHFFGGNNLYTYLLGKALFFNIIVIFFSFLSLFVFDKNPIAVIPLVSLYRNDEPTGLLGIYLLVYFALLKDRIFNKTSIFLSLYIICSFLFFQFWTTFGILWAISILPVVIYKLVITFKEKDFKQLIFPGFVLLGGVCVFAKDLFYFAKQAPFYTAGNLYGFGTPMPDLNIRNGNIYFKLASILAVPSFMLLMVKEFCKKDKNIKYLFALISSTLLILLSLNYSIGRIDGNQFTRVLIISINTLFVIIPYLIYKNKRQSNAETTKYLIFAAILTLLMTSATKISYALSFKRIPPFTEKTLQIKDMLDSKNTANDSMHQTLRFLNKYLTKEDTFLDLTNNGILYYVFNKKLPVPYTSFYNIVSDKQAEFALKILHPKFPDKILITRADFPLDNIYPSLRINPIYRHLLLDGKYRLVVDDSGLNALLIKTPDTNKFSQNELKILDDCLAKGNLGYLPDAWGNKAKFSTQEIKFNYMLEKIVIPQGTIFNIHFVTPVKGKDIDLISFDIPQKGKSSWVMQINNSPSMLFFETKTGAMLIPFDNYPSWLLNEKITDIAIKTNSNIKDIPVIKLLKRKCSRKIRDKEPSDVNEFFE